MSDEDWPRILAFYGDLNPSAQRTLSRELRARQPDLHAQLVPWLSGANRSAALDLSIATLKDTAASYPQWLNEYRSWSEAAHQSWQVEALAASDVAWAGREAGHSALLQMESDVVLGADPNDPAARSIIYLYALSLRYEFRFQELEQVLRGLSGGSAALDPFLTSLLALALLSQGLVGGEELAEKAVAAAPANSKVLHAVLHGLWFAESMRGQAERMLEICEQLLRLEPAGWVVHYRRTYALRRLGRYEEALDAVSAAFATIPANYNVQHEGLVRERALVLAEREVSLITSNSIRRVEEDSLAAVTTLRRDFEMRIAEQTEIVRRDISDALLKVVEILALFAALLAFLGLSGSSVLLGGLAFEQRLLLLVVAGVVSLGFFTLLRVVVGGRGALRIVVSRRPLARGGATDREHWRGDPAAGGEPDGVR